MTTNSTDEAIIEVQGVWKRYGLPPFLPWRKGPQNDSAFALRDISFSIPRGGSLAILGRNGAGKSTLLKLLAGVTPPDRGSIKVRGSIFPMIELTAGMSMELSGRENSKILGTIMGKLGEEFQEIVPNVLEFSELGDWFERPIWQYSSGMLARLAFSIAINVDADILIVDEVLGVGDIQFQKKCQRKIQQILGSGVTLIFVSHSPYLAEMLCEQALFLEEGGLRSAGPAAKIAKEYIETTILLPGASNDATSFSNGLPDSALRPGTGDIRVTSIVMLNQSKEETTTVKTGESIEIHVHYDAKEHIRNFNFRLDINDIQGIVVASLGELMMGKNYVIPPGSGKLVCKIPNFPLYGIFSLSLVFKTTYVLDSVQNVHQFAVEPYEETRVISGGKGHVYIDCEWDGSYK